MTLFETCQHFDTLCLPYVKEHDLGEDAIGWYMANYGEFAAHELFTLLSLIAPDVVATIARLYVTSSDELYADFAGSIGKTTEELDRLFDPETYRAKTI